MFDSWFANADERSGFREAEYMSNYPAQFSLNTSAHALREALCDATLQTH